MEIVLEVIILAVVVFIAVELMLLRLEMLKSRKSAPSEGEDRQGQIINVNLGMPDGQAHSPASRPAALNVEPVVIESNPAERVSDPAPASPTEAGSEPEPKQPPKPATKPLSKPVYPASSPKSSQGVVICGNCKAENTSFRTECFNCGSSLY